MSVYIYSRANVVAAVYICQEIIKQVAWVFSVDPADRYCGEIAGVSQLCRGSFGD
jgi:hypothetical protein